MSKEILLLNDMPGYGKVALAAQIPVLSYMGYRVHGIPTTILSNTLNYGNVEKLSTDEYMKKTIRNWEGMGIHFDAMATGMIFGREQACFIDNLCKKYKQDGVKIFCDPIMADNGRLYNGILEENVIDMRKIISSADYCFPNYTEAVILTGGVYKKEGITEMELSDLINSFKKLGAKSVIITSLVVDGKDVVACFDAMRQELQLIPYTRFDLNIPGAGDIFLALVMGKVMNQSTLSDAVLYATDVLWKMIDFNRDSQKDFPGIRIEECLHFV